MSDVTGRVDTAEGRRLLAEERQWIDDFRAGQFDIRCGCGAGERHLPPEFFGLIDSHARLLDFLDGLLAAAEELDACRRDLAEAHHKHGPDENCEVCELAAELAEERTLHQATLRALAEERARTTRLQDALLVLSSPSKRQRIDQGQGVTHYIREALRECGAGTEQPA